MFKVNTAAILCFLSLTTKPEYLPLHGSLQGIQLEPQYGSVGFALLVAELLGLSHCLVAGGAYLLAGSMRDYRWGEQMLA